MPIIGPKFSAALERRKKQGGLAALSQAFGTRRVGRPGGVQRTEKVADPGVAIRATEKAVAAIVKAEGVTPDQAANRLRNISKEIRLTRAALFGTARGIESRIAAGRTGSFDITRSALARKLSAGGDKTDPSIIQHVISTEIAKPETRFNIDGSRQALKRSRKNLLGIRR